jgi:hypothetical protein
VFNREVLGDAGMYFRTASDLTRLVELTEGDTDGTRQRASRAAARAGRYDWNTVAERYEALCRRLITQPRIRQRVAPVFGGQENRP